MKIVNEQLAVTARLVPPHDNGYLLLAAEVGTWRGPLASHGRAHRALLERLTALAARLTARDEVEEATVFRAVLRPPGEGGALLRRRGVAPARYDVVVLTRTTDPAAALALRGEPDYKELAEALGTAARRTHHIAARDTRRLGDVDHRPDDAFLFNYFYADDGETLLDVWQYTAGWFQAETGLANSALMQPLDGEPAEYGVVNHASWPTLRAFLPGLIFRPTFRRFVLANFKANGIAAQPIIYRRLR